MKTKRAAVRGLLVATGLIATLALALGQSPSSLVNPCVPTQSTYQGKLISTCLPGLPGGLEQSVTLQVTSAQLKNLFASPVVVLPAPPVGQILVATDVFYQYVYGSATYVSPGNGEGLYYLNDFLGSGGSSFPLDDAVAKTVLISTGSELGVSFMEGGDNTSVRWAYGPNVGLNGPRVSPSGQSIVLGSPAAAMTTGDGSLWITIHYYVASLH